MSRYPTAQEVKASVLLSDVIRKDVKLQENGADEWIGLCPFHSERTGSFRVYDNDGSGGHYHCFGCNAHGDVISYIEHTRQMGINAAKDHLTGGRTELVAIHPPRAMEELVDDDKGLERVDATNAPLIVAGEAFRAWNPKSKEYTIIAAEMVHPYRDVKGKLLGYTVRTSNAKALPLQFCKRPDAPDVVPEWVITGFPSDNRSLYGIEHLPASGRVVVVEGEKCVDALRGVGIIAVSWLGGAQAVAKSNWRVLTGYDVVLWPDNDEPGHHAMHGDGKKKGVLQLLDDIAASIKAVVIPERKPKGWDCADAIEEWTDCEPIIKSAGNVYREPEPEAAIPIEVSPPKRPQSYQPASKLDDNPHFRFLGHDHGKYYFIPKAGGQLRDYTAPQLSTIPCLFELASPNFWLKNYSTDVAKPSFKGEAVQIAMYDLQQSSIAKGIFNPMRVRGRGWWRDGKDMLLHLGDRILVHGDTIDVNEFQGDYIYENAKPSKVNLKDNFDVEDCDQLRRLLAMFPFTDEWHEIFLAGFMVTGFISGALKWRPHLWISGQKSSGKSTIIRELYMPLMGDFSLNLGATSTMAGITQEINKNSLVVSVDEAEAENRRDGDLRMRGILQMMRSSSSSADGQTEVKGTGGAGGAIHRQVRSQFLLASIDKIAMVPADKSRITSIDLSSKYFKHPIEDVEAAIGDTLTPDYCQRFAGRCINKCDDILRGVPIFRMALMPHIKDDRTALQIGTLLAGYWTLISDEQVTKEAAEDFVSKRNWQDMRDSAASNTDDREFFAKLLASNIMFTDENKNNRRESISFLIRCAMGLRDEEDMAMSQDTATAVLRENGIGIVAKDFNSVHFAMRSQKIKNLMENTKWQNGYQSSLENVSTHQKGKNARIEGMTQKVITIPDFWKYIGEFMG